MGDNHKRSKPGQCHLTISKDVIKMLRYLKEPAGTVAELYSRYPDGGEWGWFAIVTSLQTIVIWDVVSKKWLPISSGDSGTVVAVQADWNETDSQKPGFIKNKPNLGASGSTFEPYEKYYTPDFGKEGTFNIHPTANLYHYLAVNEDCHLNEIDEFEEVYGSLHLVITNHSGESIKVYINGKNILSIGDYTVNLDDHGHAHVIIQGYGNNRLMTINPEANENIIPNKSLNTLYANPAEGEFYFDRYSNLTHSALIDKDTILVEYDIPYQSYSTTYLLYTNVGDKALNITFPEGTDFYYGFASHVELEPFETVEIAIKSYGYERVITYAKLINI